MTEPLSLAFSKALLAVAQVGAHGGAGGFGVLVADCDKNTFVFLVDALQIGQAPLRGRARRVHAGARNNHAAQVGHEVGKMAVSGDPRHFHVKLEVGRHCVRVSCDRFLKAAQGALHGQQMGLGATLRG